MKNIDTNYTFIGGSTTVIHQVGPKNSTQKDALASVSHCEPRPNLIAESRYPLPPQDGDVGSNMYISASYKMSCPGMMSDTQVCLVFSFPWGPGELGPTLNHLSLKGIWGGWERVTLLP